MNRRGFLKALGAAAIGAAALELADPERLLWVPGAKTIVDLGATRHLETPSNAMLAGLFDLQQDVNRDAGLVHTVLAWASVIDDYANREIRLDIVGAGGGLVSFRFLGDRLVSRHTPEQLRLLDRQPLFPGRRNG